MATATAKKETAKTPAVKTPAAPKKKVEQKETTRTVYAVANALDAGVKKVGPNSVGASIWKVIGLFPKKQASAEEVTDKLIALKKDGDDKLEGVKAKEWLDASKRTKYVSGYLTWLKGNGNLKIAE